MTDGAGALQLESAGFEVKNIDVIGVHYSATIYRWYKNWLANKEKVIAKYGERWYRIWVYFLGYSTIVARCVALLFHLFRFPTDQEPTFTAKVGPRRSRLRYTRT